MKKIFTVSVALLTYVLSIAQPPSVPATAGSSFGEKVTADKAITIDQLQSLLLSKNEGSRKADVKIKGVVTDVCTMEGCWIKVQSPDGKMMVKMKDHQFAVPVALNGKTVVIAGEAEEKITSVEQLKHFAMDAGKSKEEIAAIKEAKKEIVIDAKGVLVL
ncbi:DUF4920 domain-containing protein [Segetibacter aerophilus]|uniref:DUF4920 domain-containing protein n=1 Tax=Segetibacter aerophilus TaxID=670293 RepID=A0A512BI80_9BACT|nr:DUF4920 domain-containing protein [Segetibacter aerophilus]GEO11689.1 hypothetical protein SAE01_41850 [Segetibacter aerophilus]